MATKKQKRLAAAAKHDQFMAEEKRRGLEEQKRVQGIRNEFRELKTVLDQSNSAS